MSSVLIDIMYNVQTRSLAKAGEYSHRSLAFDETIDVGARPHSLLQFSRSQSLVRFLNPRDNFT